MWYSNPLAQWFDIPLTATPTHDEKGTGRVAGLPRTREWWVGAKCPPRSSMPARGLLTSPYDPQLPIS